MPLACALDCLQSPYHVNIGIFCVVLMEQIKEQQLQQALSSHPGPKPCSPPARATGHVAAGTHGTVSV